MLALPALRFQPFRERQDHCQFVLLDTGRHLDRPALRLDDSRDKRQADAASRLHRTRYPVKAFEDPRALVDRHARPVVRDTQPDSRPIRVGTAVARDLAPPAFADALRHQFPALRIM